jgi:hypothetical protein
MKNRSIEALEAERDARIATWQDAKTKADEAQKNASAPPGTFKNDRTEVLRVGAEIASLEALDAAALAQAHASSAADAFDVARGDELAIARDAGCLHADLLAILEEEERLAEALAQARQARTERLAKAEDAHAKLASRRRADALPPPVNVPAVDTARGPRAFLDVLSARVASGVPEVKNSEGRLRRLRAEEHTLLASIEARHRELEEEKRRAAAYDKRKEEEAKAEAARHVAELDALRAKYAAATAEEKALADAARARISG